MARITTHLGRHGRHRLTLEEPALLRAPSAKSVAEHEGRLPQPGVPSGPRNTPSASAHYHSDLSIPGYQPSTPTTAPPPGEGATEPAGDYAGAGRAYHQAVTALPPPAQLLPAPTSTPAPSTAPTLASLLGGDLTPEDASTVGTLLGKALSPAGAVSALDALLGGKGPASAPAPKVPPPPPAPKLAALHDSNPATAVISSRPAALVAHSRDPLGPKTLGDVSARQLLEAGQHGTLQINQGGKLTIPATRQAAHELVTARKAVAESGPDLKQLHQRFPELSLQTLRAYRAASRITGVPAPLLAGIEGQESDYGRSTLPGVRSGANFAGASGPFQIGTGGGAAGDWWHEHMPPGANPYNDRTAAVGAGKYLTEAGATKDPSTWYNAALSYNHAGWYASKAVQIAQEHQRLARLGLPPNPSAVQALKAAKHNARAQGINPTPFNGDVEGGGAQTVYVRADAQGMVHWAESALGTAEGSPKQVRWASNQGLSSSQPWCANFISNGLARRGVPLPPNPNYVPSYETEWSGGHSIGTDLSKAKPGDLIAYSGDHIALYKGNGKVISGNYGNEVAESNAAEGPAPVSAILRPDYKGGKVAVHESAALPGSTAAGAFSGSEGVAGAAAAGGGAFGGGQGQLAAAAPAALTQLQSPISAGPVLPGLAGVGAEGEGGEDTAAELLELLASGRRPARRGLI